MKCLILAAGYATRLYPLTKNFPKPLLEVGGRAILDWLIGDLENSGLIGEYVVISNHRFAGHFNSWAAGRSARITVLDDGTTSNDTRLGAVRDIQFTLNTLNIREDILVMAGDNLLDFSIGEFLRFAREKQTSCVMCYREPSREKLRQSGVAVLDEHGKVLKMTEKSPDPASNWCVPAFYYFTAPDAARIGEAIAEGCGTDAPGSFIAWLCKRSPVHAMEMPGRRFDIGTPESYAKIKATYRGIVK